MTQILVAVAWADIIASRALYALPFVVRVLWAILIRAVFRRLERRSRL